MIILKYEELYFIWFGLQSFDLKWFGLRWQFFQRKSCDFSIEIFGYLNKTNNERKNTTRFFNLHDFFSSGFKWYLCHRLFLVVKWYIHLFSVYIYSFFYSFSVYLNFSGYNCWWFGSERISHDGMHPLYWSAYVYRARIC